MKKSAIFVALICVSCGSSGGSDGGTGATTTTPNSTTTTTNTGKSTGSSSTAGTGTKTTKESEVTLPTTPVAVANEILVYGEAVNSYVYLGCWSCDQFNAESIHNEFGTYGSEFSTTSINNEFSTYGSKFGANAACNELSSTAPSLFSPGLDIYYGLLSVNILATDSICNQVSMFYSRPDCEQLVLYCTN
jgi:hypothetical protein